MSGETHTRTCTYCHVKLPEYSGVGRPTSYCGEPCRRGAELEIRRVNLRVDRLENELSHVRTHGEQSALAVIGGAEDAMTRIGAELDRQRARLAELLAGEA
ncbi:MAG: hypothetical protein IPF57_11770 [Gammaproteobacteria bacterium]|nr:hypothetical protein [Gammaproteobacteria bacterium]MBK9467997.1 hypothetical protein [Gammaproteobacteria bacterium]MBP7910243.1 hypothetical protein [Pseudomonadales bacterium]